MKGIISQMGGWIIIVTYAAIMIGSTWIFTKKLAKTKLYFLAAERKVPMVAGAFSIAAAWVWAPALFIAAQKAYEQGIVGLFWFTVPNVACLIIFAFFADILRKRVPEGYTLSGYVLERFSKRVNNMYLLELGGLSVCSFAVQLLAGGTVLATLTGIPFYQVTIALALIALSYTFWRGINASVVTDYIDMVFMVTVAVLFIPWAISNAGGSEVLLKGLGGITGRYKSLFDSTGGQVFLSFGLPVTIGLLSGPFGDQSFWQRAFALKEGSVKGAFILAAFIFATVPITMSLLGFGAAGTGLKVASTQLVNLEMIAKYLPFWTIVPFVYMLLMGLCSTLDSSLSAVSSLGGHDMATRVSYTGNEIDYSRIYMAGMAVCGILIANIPGMKILYLFLFYATLRSSTLLPTVTMILKERNISESGMFYGIIASLIIGLPIFAYGNFNKITPFIVAGSLMTVLLSGIIVWTTSKARIGDMK
jgi:Na+/proline symporter